MEDPTVIVCSPNGPLRISGNFVIKDGEGKDFDLSGRNTIGLCRCGFSANKPFCDGSHGRQGFQSVVEARKLPPPPPKPGG
jgi:CDGSH-type Zn-finger protein